MQLAYRSFQLINKLLATSVLVDTSGTVDIAVTVDSATNSATILLVNYNWFNLTIADESVTVMLKGLSCLVRAQQGDDCSDFMSIESLHTRRLFSSCVCGCM